MGAPTTPVSCTQRMNISGADTALKGTGLYIMSAIAVIGLIGSVACALSINGFAFGRINSIAQMVGPQNIYIALLGSTSLLAISAVLFGAHLSKVRNKQLSEKEMEKIDGLQAWIGDQKPGETGVIGKEFQAKGGQRTVFALVTSKNYWVYRNENDYLAQVGRLSELGLNYQQSKD